MPFGLLRKPRRSRALPGFWRVRGASLLTGLVLSAGLSGCPGEAQGSKSGSDPGPEAAKPEVKPASPAKTPELLLEAVVKERCLRLSDPWALAHGILVFGPQVKVEGREAWRGLLARLPEGKLLFPPGRPGQPIEPHPGMFLKALVETGLPWSTRFQFGGTSRTLDALGRALLAEPVKARRLPFHNEAWRLEVLAAAPWAKAPRRARAARESLALLAREQRYLEGFLRAPKRRYRKPFVKVKGRPRAAAIHRYYCGGLHLFQAVQALHGKACPPVLARQYVLLRYRLVHESAYWRRHLARAQKDPARRAREEATILAQLLKLEGHALETLLRATASGALALKSVRAEVLKGFTQLSRTLRDLERAGVYARLDSIRAQNPQLYLDLVGDSAHALHAWGLAKTQGLHPKEGS